ncbi:decapping endonuclease targeting mRNA [Sorochytrium milnesiophthora]
MSKNAGHEFEDDDDSSHKKQRTDGPGQRKRPAVFAVQGYAQRGQKQQQCPVFQQPTEIACYSHDEQRRFVPGSSELKYYCEPSLASRNGDLNAGFDQYLSRNLGEVEPLDNLLRALESTSQWQNGLRSSVDVVTWRGIMTRILTAPYNNSDPWELGATLHKGTLYIQEHMTPHKTRSNDGSDPRQAIMSYWGYKFETLCNLPRHPSTYSDDAELEKAKQARLTEIVNNNVQYCSIVKTKLGNTRMVLGAEVDCTLDAEQQPGKETRGYIELKTSRVIENERQQMSFDRKLLKFWAQSFLAGIPKVIVGFRDDDGMLLRLSTFNTMEMPRMVRGKTDRRGAPLWDATVCLQFADAFLQFLRRVCTREGNDTTYVISFDRPWREITVTELPAEQTGHRAVLPESCTDSGQK